MKKYTKVISVILMVLLLASMATTVLATFTPNSVRADENNTTGIQKIGNSILGIVRVVGIITSVIILAIIGIKYMMGSAQEKAEYKKTMIPYVIGAMLLLGASVFSQMIYNWASGLNLG